MPPALLAGGIPSAPGLLPRTVSILKLRGAAQPNAAVRYHSFVTDSRTDLGSIG